MMRRLSLAAFAAALALGFAWAPAAYAQKKRVACSKIMSTCMARAGDGHAAICEDMYARAKIQGYWQATEEPDGTKHAAIPCTPN
ncbi:MAG: hypothetical protein KGM42_08025 [Hyphomicrobiales bacterium]|nr:hypothetical protein [Hyphomicrobiales bacterium]